MTQIPTEREANEVNNVMFNTNLYCQSPESFQCKHWMLEPVHTAKDRVCLIDRETEVGKTRDSHIRQHRPELQEKAKIRASSQGQKPVPPLGPPPPSARPSPPPCKAAQGMLAGAVASRALGEENALCVL